MNGVHIQISMDLELREAVEMKRQKKTIAQLPDAALDNRVKWQTEMAVLQIQAIPPKEEEKERTCRLSKTSEAMSKSHLLVAIVVSDSIWLR